MTKYPAAPLGAYIPPQAWQGVCCSTADPYPMPPCVWHRGVATKHRTRSRRGVALIPYIRLINFPRGVLQKWRGVFCKRRLKNYKTQWEVLGILSDFEMIEHRFEGNDDVVIIPISDVQLGAREHLRKEWDTFVSGVLDRPRTYLMLGGDLMNNATKTSVSNVFEEVLRPSEAKRQLVTALTPLKERILCGVPGNHERRNKDVDDDPMYDIMCKLDLEHLYRENMAFVKVGIGSKEGSGIKNPTYMFCVSHGHGSSIYTSAAASKAERFGMAIDGIDCLIVGHTHKPLNVPVGKIKVDAHNNKVSVVPWRLVVSTSWLGYAGYAGQKLLTPTVHCPQEILLSGRCKELKVLQ